MLGSNHLTVSKEGAKGMKRIFPDDLRMYWNESIFYRRSETKIFILVYSMKNLPFCQYFIYLKKDK